MADFTLRMKPTSPPIRSAPLALTPGEPAGIGPDLAVRLAQQQRDYEIVAFASRELLLQRAEALNLPLAVTTVPPAEFRDHLPISRDAGTLTVQEVPLETVIDPGTPTPNSASYVLETLRLATEGCLSGDYSALVTGPIHKGIINQAGAAGLLGGEGTPEWVARIPFTGHTEYLQRLCGVDEVVMMLAIPGQPPAGMGLRVALATTHLPLSEVPAAITREKLERILPILHHGLNQQFGISDPRILVAGLNPHAGEEGHLGREEIEVITPVLEQLRKSGMDLVGPLPADTLFTRQSLERADAVLAMYHDQGLPVLKHNGFGRAVNITLGLPFLRTSVDHGTALELAGTGKADTGSLEAAIEVALGR